MTLDQKIAYSKHLISEWLVPEKTALMCSFGKDSMALLHLIKNTLPPQEMTVHQYPVPIIQHRFPWFPAKNEFADYVIRSWALEVHDYPPGACGIKYTDDRLELVARYPFGTSAMDLPVNTEEFCVKRDFVCGLKDFIERPKVGKMEWKWETVYIGHKSSDTDPFEGSVPLKFDATAVGGTALVFPLRHWSDEDVWDYIEQNHIPYDLRRYKDRVELEDKWLNPDYLHACTRCIDPRNDAQVFCPKLKRNVENVGNRVLRLQMLPEYIEA